MKRQDGLAALDPRTGRELRDATPTEAASWCALTWLGTAVCVGDVVIDDRGLVFAEAFAAGKLARHPRQR